MGKSQKIQDAAAKDKEFQEFLEQRQKTIQPKIEAYRKDFEAELTRFYADTKSEHITIAEGEKWDYHLSSDIGAGTMKQRVTDMVYSVFGMANSSQSGKTELNNTENGSVTMVLSESVKKVLSLVSDYKVLAAAAACNFVIQAMNLFSSKLEIGDDHNYSSQALVPGLTLHMDLYSNSYSNERFLHSDKIVTSYARFQLIYSYSLAQTITDMDCIQKLQASIAYQSESLVAMQKALVDMIAHMTPETKDDVIFQKMAYDMLHQLYVENYKELTDIVNAHKAKADTQNTLLRANAQPKLDTLRAKLLSEVLAS